MSKKRAPLLSARNHVTNRRSYGTTDPAASAIVRRRFRDPCEEASHALSDRLGDRRIAAQFRTGDPQNYSGSRIDLSGGTPAAVVLRSVGYIMEGPVAQPGKCRDACLRP